MKCALNISNKNFEIRTNFETGASSSGERGIAEEDERREAHALHAGRHREPSRGAADREFDGSGRDRLQSRTAYLIHCVRGLRDWDATLECDVSR